MCRPTKRVRDLRQIVENMGCEVLDVTISGGTHVRLKVRREGRERTVFAGFSPSDWRAQMNFRRDLLRTFSTEVRGSH